MEFISTMSIENTNCTDLIFENYGNYMQTHRSELATPQGAIEMLSTDGNFNAYVSSLTEGLEPYQRAAVMAVCEREREMLLEESAGLGPSASVIGYAVNNIAALLI